MRFALALLMVILSMVCVTVGALPMATPTPTLPAQATPTDQPSVLEVCRVSTGIESGALTLRSGPGVDYTPVTWMLERQAVEFIRAGRGWLQVKYGNLIGWVNQDFVECGK